MKTAKTKRKNDSLTFVHSSFKGQFELCIQDYDLTLKYLRT